MKAKFSINWNKSIKPNKQRKYVFNAPLHIKNRFLSCNLTKSLRSEYGIRSIRVKTKDTVKIMRGEHKGKTGEVTKVNVKDKTLHIKDINRKKVSGQETNLPIQPSNVQIIELDTKDERRLKSLRKKKEHKQEKKDTKIKEKSKIDNKKE
ncbi:MAG: 50S ribosomal protein L24 [archaeon]